MAAKRTVEIAERARVDAVRDREYQRLVRIGELVVEVFWGAEGQQNRGLPQETWMHPRNRLRQLLVGIQGEVSGPGDRLPRCREVAQAGTPVIAMAAAADAQVEVESALETLDKRQQGQAP